MAVSAQRTSADRSPRDTAAAALDTDEAMCHDIDSVAWPMLSVTVARPTKGCVEMATRTASTAKDLDSNDSAPQDDGFG